MSNKRISVVLVNQTSGTGGSERLAYSLAKCLDRERFRVVACALDGTGPMREEYKGAGLPFCDMKKRKGIDLLLIPRLVRFFAAHRADIVNTHDFAPLNYCFLATHLLRGTRLVHTNQIQLDVMLEKGTVRPRQAKLLRRLLPRVDGLVCAAENVRQSYLRNEFPPGKIHTIYNGVDLVRFQPTSSSRRVRTGLGLKPDDFVIGCAANFRPQKDHATMLRAFRRVLDKVKNAHLLLMGHGELFEQSKHLARELKLDGRAHFLGARLDVPDIMAALDVYCLSSLFEGLPVSVLEALAAGRAIVATDVVGTNEIIEDGKNGVLVPARDPRALSSALLHVHDHPGIARRLASAARTAAEERYSLETTVSQYAWLYEDLSFGGQDVQARTQ